MQHNQQVKNDITIHSSIMQHYIMMTTNNDH